MEKSPCISVIVPVYNVAPYLERCVASICAQTYLNLEILLVDDGSTDDSGQICDRLARTDARIRVIHKENGGLSSARNAGLDAAAGDFVGFVDSDDWIEPDMYEAMLALMQRYDAQLVCAGRYDVDETTSEKTVGLCPARQECISGEALTGRIFVWDNCDSSACDKLFRAELFQNIRFPEGWVSEDVATIYRVTLRASRAGLCSRPLYHYFHRRGSISKGAPITDKTFHYCRHTAVIYPYIRKEHPAIASQARFLRVHSLSHILLRLDQAAPHIRKKYAAQYRDARRELAKHLGFFLTCPWLRGRERVTDLLLVLGLYRFLRPLFHK